MPDSLDKAIDKLRSLPPQRRRIAAAMIEEFIASETGPVHVLSDEERTLVAEGLAELDRGEFVTQAQVDAMLDEYLKS